MSWLTDSPWPLYACGALYVLVAVGFYQTGRHGLALTHLAYAVANIGLVMAWYGR